MTLRVSRGPIIDKVENYVGMSLDDVKIHLQTLFATHSPNLIIKDPSSTATSRARRPGRVLAQSPPPGTKITGLTYLELVVSQDQGAESTITVGDYVGKSFTGGHPGADPRQHSLHVHREEGRQGVGPGSR